MVRTKPKLVGANSAAGTSVTIPAHNIGDLIVLFVYRDGASFKVTKPAATSQVPAWVDIDDGAIASSSSAHTAYFQATRTDHTTGVWTNATAVAVAVIRGIDGTSPIGGHAVLNSTSATGVASPGITLSQSDGTSLVLEFYGHRTVTAWGAAPAGHTRQTEVATEVCFNTRDITTSGATVTQDATTSASAGCTGVAIEVLGDTKPTTYDENVDRINSLVPEGASGCYVTLHAGGGGGGSGGSVNDASGGGGGGGARITRVFIPKALLGPTFTSLRGLGGAGGPAYPTATKNGDNGGDSQFVSGSISLVAGGGLGGVKSGIGGKGGVVVVTGITGVTGLNGTDGASGKATQNGAPAVPNPNGAGAGGGAGGGGQGGPYSGGAGGDSSTVNGGAGGLTPGPNKNGVDGGSAPDAAKGFGGAGGGGGSGASSAGTVFAGNGGDGGDYGGGGGGGGTRGGSSGGGAGGRGGDGYNLVEWVISPGTFFPFIAA